MNEITEARRLRAAATQGEWEIRDNIPYTIDGRVIFTGRGKDNKTIARFMEDMRAFPESLANIELIAFAANNILSFADKIDELQSALDDANGQLGEFFNTPSGAIIKKLETELDALKKEYDEEVISHDIEEDGFREKIKALQAQVEELHASRNHLFETVKELRVRDANALTVIEQLRAEVRTLRNIGVTLEQQNADLKAACESIVALNPTTDSHEGFNEWGEADCFNQAQTIAGKALASK